MDILFVNCCISQKKENSRTLALCRAFVEAYEQAHPQDEISELVLEQEPLSWMTVPKLDRRDGLIGKGGYDDELFRYARRFARADKIIVGAPYWDKSFPALLKVYIENVSVNGIAFHYTENGPEGLCRARKLLYLLTCGGEIGKADSGIAYLEDVCDMFGIKAYDSIAAEGLDIEGADIKALMEQACNEARALAGQW